MSLDLSLCPGQNQDFISHYYSFKMFWISCLKSIAFSFQKAEKHGFILQVFTKAKDS